MTEPESRLLPEDRSEITVVDDRRREPWFRKARPDYFCPRCGRYHRTWSKIGEAHDTRKPPSGTREEGT